MISNSIRVLVVEGDPAVLLGTQQALQLADFEVEPLADAESALTSVVPDVPAIICDVKLPGLDGLGLLATAHSIDRDLAVILITGHGDVAMAVNAMRLGPYDFVEKPFPDRLVEMASVLIEDALAEHHGNESLVCQSLGIPKRTLYDKMRKLGLSTEEFHASDAREAIVNAAAKSVGGRA
jgi:DNA-binding NtrC family response regulator